MADSSTDPRLSTLLERLRNATFTRGARVIAFTAPHADAGTSLLANLFARRLFETGLRVLLIDASLSGDRAAAPAAWQPGDGTAASMVARFPDAPDHLWLAVHPDDTGRFNDPRRLQSMFDTDLVEYDAILVDCAPVGVGAGAAVEAMTIAAIAGATLLVGKANRTLGHERDAAQQLLRECGARLTGIVVNEIEAQSLGAEIARELRRLRRFAPVWVSRLGRRVEAMASLSVPA